MMWTDRGGILYIFHDNKFRHRSPLDFPQSARIPQRHSAQFPPFCDAALRFGQIITPVGCDGVVNVGAVAGAGASAGAGAGGADLELIWHRKRERRHYAGDADALKCVGGWDILA